MENLVESDEMYARIEDDVDLIVLSSDDDSGEVSLPVKEEIIDSSPSCSPAAKKPARSSKPNLCHEGNPATPLFERTARTYSISDIVYAVFGNLDKKMLCTQQPMRVTYNSIFLINTKEINVKDIVADGNGVFLNIGQPTVTISVDSGTNFKILGRKKQLLTSPNQFHVRRLYYRHSKKEKFFRRIYDVRDKEGNIVNDIVIVQYVWDGDEEDVKLAPHGNAKSTKTPYTCTKATVRQRLTYNLGRHNLKEAIDLTNDCEDSSVFTAKSAANTVRDVQQANYIARKLRKEAGTSKKHKEEFDELYSLMTAAKQDHSDFIRCIANHPDPMCILATDIQLDDLEKSSTADLDYRPVTIDPTFNNGRFNVTPLSYRNVMLESRRTQKSPVFLGPILIHQRKTFQSYNYFTSQLVGLRPNLRNIKAFGTDGEDALIKACAISFPSAIPLRCFRHFRQNVETFVKSCGLQGSTAEVIGQIFGSEESNGLLDSESANEFDLRLQQLSAVWSGWKNGDKLAKFVLDRSDMMKKSMVAEVRTKAGLGFPPVKFYDNDSECNNERIKQRMEHREAGLCAFVYGMKELALSQENELVKALYGSSKEYKLRGEFSSFQIEPDDWYDMSEDQRRKKVAKIHKFSVAEMYRANDPTASSSPVANLTPTSTQTENANDAATGSCALDLSVKVEHTGLEKAIPHTVVAGIWQKASRLLKGGNSTICSAPSSRKEIKAFSALNQSGKDHIPYYIEINVAANSHTKVTCTCPMYKPNKICSHSVAVAERCGLLPSFVRWRLKDSQPGNFMSLATMGINTSTSGRKGGKVKRSRTSSKTTPSTQQSSCVHNPVEATQSQTPAMLPGTSSAGVALASCNSVLENTPSSCTPSALFSSQGQGTFFPVSNIRHRYSRRYLETI